MSRVSSVPSEMPKPLVVDVVTAGHMLGGCRDFIYKLLRTGQLASYRDGRSRKVLVSSIEEFVAKRLAATGEKFEPARYPKRRASASGKSRDVGNERRQAAP